MNCVWMKARGDPRRVAIVASLNIGSDHLLDTLGPGSGGMALLLAGPSPINFTTVEQPIYPRSAFGGTRV